MKLYGTVGEDTFGFERYLNQILYKSSRWRELRNHIIVRDSACDLAVDDREICDRIIIHHINPITIDDIIEENENVFNPEFLITTSHNTHNAIHYGDESLLIMPLVERQPGDTTLW